MNRNRAVEAAGAFVRAFALGLVLCAGSGCVAFNVGKPEFFSKTVSVCETPETPTRSAAVSTVAVADQRDRELVVSLSASVRDEYDRLRHDETVTVTVRRRMAVGLFPGMAESLLMPPGALKSMAFEFNTDGTRLWDDKHGWKGVWNDIAGFARIGIPSLGLAPLVFSVDTLFFEPFASYSCVSHPWMEEDWRYGSEPNRSEPPNVRALSLLTWEERKRIGVFPRWNHSFRNYIDFMGHFALVGVRKYQAVSVAGPLKGPATVDGTDVKTRNGVLVPGPFVAVLSIPGLEYSDSVLVPAGTDKATFRLPSATENLKTDAIYSFRAAGNAGAAPELTRQALALSAGKSWRGDVSLKTAPKIDTGGQPGVPQRVVVNEIHHHYHETPAAPARRFDIQKSVVADGRTVWRVTILDESLTAFDADSEAKPEILRNLRDEFLERNPSVRPEDVRAYAGYTTENGGRVLVYVGAASSMIPSLQKMSYDAASRRGAISMKLVDGADLIRSKSFVRENIGAIVCDKNVALTSGQRPPDGATYRSLDENFSDGVLTVEFEAVQ